MKPYRKALAGVLLAAMVWSSSALAASGASQSDAATSLAREINAAGFAAWSSLGDRSAVQDAMVSPLAMWYVDRFTDPAWTSLNPAVTVALKALRERTAFAGVICANATKSRFSASEAAAAARLWGVSTAWTSKSRSDVSIDVSMREAFSFKKQSKTLPFAHGDGLRAVRLDSADGRAEVYLIQGTRERLLQFRTEMTEPAWERFTKQFRDAGVQVEPFHLSRSSYTEVPVTSQTLFGDTVLPAAAVQHAIYGDQAVALSTQDGAIRVGYAIRAKFVPPPASHTYGKRTTVSVFHVPDSITYAAAPPLPRERYISLYQPLAYVVVDRPSGIVLLAGMHD